MLSAIWFFLYVVWRFWGLYLERCFFFWYTQMILQCFYKVFLLWIVFCFTNTIRWIQQRIFVRSFFSFLFYCRRNGTQTALENDMFFWSDLLVIQYSWSIASPSRHPFLAIYCIFDFFFWQFILFYCVFERLTAKHHS